MKLKRYGVNGRETYLQPGEDREFENIQIQRFPQGSQRELNPLPPFPKQLTIKTKSTHMQTIDSVLVFQMMYFLLKSDWKIYKLVTLKMLPLNTKF